MHLAGRRLQQFSALVRHDFQSFPSGKVLFRKTFLQGGEHPAGGGDITCSLKGLEPLQACLDARTSGTVCRWDAGGEGLRLGVGFANAVLFDRRSLSDDANGMNQRLHQIYGFVLHRILYAVSPRNRFASRLMVELEQPVAFWMVCHFWPLLSIVMMAALRSVSSRRPL